ncbi:MAG: hypothetical protein ACI9QL_002832 [Candidatus Omnitrophota bacterium]
MLLCSVVSTERTINLALGGLGFAAVVAIVAVIATTIEFAKRQYGSETALTHLGFGLLWTVAHLFLLGFSTFGGCILLFARS